MVLFRRLVGELAAGAPTRSLRYHDFRLLAIDGTAIVLPVDRRLMEHFGGPRNQTGLAEVPHAGLVSLMDIGLNAPIDFTLTPAHPNERHELEVLCRSLRKGDLVLADRGFPSRATFDAIRRTGADFLIRVPTHQFKEVDAFLATGLREAEVTISPMDGKGRKQVYAEPFTLRLIRDDSLESGGKPRVFATTLLDTQRYLADDLAYLYTRRWAIETSYRDVKNIFAGEMIHARTAQGVEQEVIAILFYQVLLALMEAETLRYNDVQPIQVEHVKRAPSASDPGVTVSIRDAMAVSFTFSKPLMMEMVADILGLLLRNDYQAAHHEAIGSCRYLWRLKRKRRPGRSAPRIPKSPNAKQKTARRAAVRTRALR